MTITICRGPATELVHDEPHGDPRWCFKCRKRRQFRFQVLAPTEPSYYGPNMQIVCGTCGLQDGDCFPGTIREWEADQ